MAASAAVAAALFATATLAQARQQDAALDLTLEMGDCPAISPAAVRRALEVESGTRLQASPTPTEPVSGAVPTRKLVVRCDAAQAFLAVESAAGGRLDRQLALRELAGDTAPRLVALAALELLAALDPELRRKLADVDIPVAEPPVPPAPRTVMGIGAVYRTFSAPSGVDAWGGQVVFDRALGTHLGIAGGIEVSGARRATPPGESTALLASASVSGGWRAGDRHLGVRVEGGGRGGLVRLSGAAPSPDVIVATVVRPWAGPFAAAHLLVKGGSLCLDLAAETGVAVVAARGLANDTPALEVNGAWLALSLTLGLQR